MLLDLWVVHRILDDRNHNLIKWSFWRSVQKPVTATRAVSSCMKSVGLLERFPSPSFEHESVIRAPPQFIKVSTLRVKVVPVNRFPLTILERRRDGWSLLHDGIEPWDSGKLVSKPWELADGRCC